jgi:hypothetical protein
MLSKSGRGGGVGVAGIFWGEGLVGGKVDLHTKALRWSSSGIR